MTTTKDDKEDIISLINLEIGQYATVIAVTACPKSAKRLADLGLTPNTSIKVVRKTLFRGPIEIKARGSNLILGKGLAAKILVKKA